jgi:hypothetical protein
MKDDIDIVRLVEEEGEGAGRSEELEKLIWG